MAFTGILGSVFSQFGEIELAYVPFTPPPDVLIESLHAPQIVRTPPGSDFDKRVRYNFDILSSIINSLTRQGYIERTSINPEIWRILTVSNRFPTGVLFTGSGAPGPDVGWVGAYYLDTVAGGIYQFTSTGWSKIFDIASTAALTASRQNIFLESDQSDESMVMPGPAGRPGAAGIPGAPGADGADGEDGAAGTPGSAGTAGVAGAAGAAGASGQPGAALYLVEDQPSEDIIMLPGPTGPQGATGASGSGATTAAFTAPVDGTFSWINQGTATTAATSNPTGVYFLAPFLVAGSNMIIRYKAAPATPYHVELYVMPTFLQNDYAFGLVFIESGTGKLVSHFAQQSDSPAHCKMAVVKHPDATTGGTYYGGFPLLGLILPNYFRVGDDNTNLTFDLSPDGNNWWNMFTVGRTDYMAGGPDQVGFFLYPSNAVGSTIPLAATILHWKVTA